MNFYERAKNLRDKYISEMQKNSIYTREAESKLHLLSLLVSKAFYNDKLSYKKNPDELPSIFSIDARNLHFSLEYNASLLNHILKDLGYDKFSITTNDATYQTPSPNPPITIFVDFRWEF